MYFYSHTNWECVPERPNDGKEEDCPQVAKEETIRHKVARIQNDWWEHVEEERFRRQRRDVEGIGRVEEEEANGHADEDEETGFRENVTQFRSHVEN